jgi:hypothetical protein
MPYAPTKIEAIGIQYNTSEINDSSVDMAMGYGMDGRDSIPGKGKILLFSTESRPTLRPTEPPIQ